ncbi:hypothetical protein GYMLUDRAFT_266513 [Collybiopsis luxurians FD-317 M1]|nr:hypothetical protein GYMLUDRAFT_266513 [Collybiopsis luxurians FD-317 M1]
MAKDINQMSDLDMLFARLVLPSGSAAKAASRPASSTAQGPSLLETFMNTDPTPSNSIPHSTTASHQFPSSTSKVTLESLFASAVDSTTSSHLAGTKSMSKTKIALNGHRSTLATTKTGLALLDDIFASASTSSNTTPSGSHLENNDESSESLSVSEDADQPETIEIHSPRPQAPLSLASMFDAAAVDSSPSPSIIPGLGLGLQHMEPAVQEAHPMIFTQQVIDNLLGQGGSMTFRNEPVSSSDRVLNPRSVPTQVNDSKQKGAQNEVLDRLGSGSQTQHHLHLKAGDVSGDVTPRVAVNDIQPIDANKVPLNMHNSLAFSPDPVIPSSVNETANIDYPAFDDDDDEEEAILELDFSDTLALSDLRVFENKERALREQIIERKVASRNASRSTTPAIASQIEVTPLKARSILNGVSNKQILVSTPPPVASQMQAPSTFFGAAVVNPSKVNPTDTSARPSTPASNKKVTIPVTPPTPTSTSAVSATLDGASPSSTKKKTRRGRGKGKDKNREGSPVSEARSRSAVDEPEISPLGAVPEEVQLNGKLAERSGGPTTSVENTPAEINGMTVKDSLDMPSRIKDCLHSALSEKTIDVESKEGLVEFVVKLLQTDRVFVDDLWNAWEGNVGSSVAQVAPHEKHSSPPANTPPSSSETASSLVDEPIQSHETALSAPQLILTQSAPAMLPTLANGARSDVPDLESESSLPASPELQDADNSFMPPMVRDVISLEAERTVIDASAEMGEAPAEGNVDFAQEEETYLVESIL